MRKYAAFNSTMTKTAESRSGRNGQNAKQDAWNSTLTGRNKASQKSLCAFTARTGAKDHRIMMQGRVHFAGSAPLTSATAAPAMERENIKCTYFFSQATCHRMLAPVPGATRAHSKESVRDSTILPSPMLFEYQEK